MLTTISLEASCSGTSVENPLLLCDAEVETVRQQAIANCCADSKIYYYDYCNDVSGSWEIGTSGPNSSCPPT